MQDDFISDVVRLFDVEHSEMAGATEEADARILAVFGVVATLLERRIGRDGVFKTVAETLDAGSLVRTTEIPVAVALTPAAQMADTLLGLLRERDPLKPAEAIAGHDEAGAMVLAGAAFLQERHGIEHAGAYVTNLVRAVHDAALSGQHPVSAPERDAPVLPPPEGIRNLTPQHRAGLTIAQRVNAMSMFLCASAPTEAQADALALMASASRFLHQRYGEAFAVDAIRRAEAAVSQAAALDHWKPEGAARN